MRKLSTRDGVKLTGNISVLDLGRPKLSFYAIGRAPSAHWARAKWTLGTPNPYQMLLNAIRHTNVHRSSHCIHLHLITNLLVVDASLLRSLARVAHRKSPFVPLLVLVIALNNLIPIPLGPFPLSQPCLALFPALRPPRGMTGLKFRPSPWLGCIPTLLVRGFPLGKA